MHEFARLGTATVYEANGQRGLVDVEWHQIVPGSRVAGPARTARCGQGDNLTAHELLTDVRPGDILVLTMDSPAPFALVGDLMATQAHAQGAAALLVDAAVRDVDRLREIGLPIWARFVSVRAATKAIAGSVDRPVDVGGQRITPGDMLVMDSDGVVVVEQRNIDDALALSLGREVEEEEIRGRLASGAFTRDVLGLRADTDPGRRCG